MKHYAVLSDVHGNLPALRAVLDALRDTPLDGMLVAGDLTGGPQPNETIRLLLERGAYLIRGNTDENILRYVSGQAPDVWHTSKQWAIMRWSVKQLAPDLLALLQSLPEQRVVALPGAGQVRMVHGSPRSSSEGLFPHKFPERLEAALALTPEAVLICGHTHLPWQLEREGKLVCNPGSVAASLNGIPHAHYALLEWDGQCWAAEHFNVPYDLASIRRANQDSGLLADGGALARAFLLANEHGYDVASDFFALIRKLMPQQAAPDLSVIPDEVWDHVERLFDWGKWEQ